MMKLSLNPNCNLDLDIKLSKIRLCLMTDTSEVMRNTNMIDRMKKGHVSVNSLVK